MYYVTVDRNGEQLVRRMVFDDYGEALRYLAMYYEPRLARGTLSFTTEVIDHEFARSFCELADPETIDQSDEARYVRAVKMSNAFKYNGSYFFLIESEFGVQDADREEDDE